jgi:hypothetical protein
MPLLTTPPGRTGRGLFIDVALEYVGFVRGSKNKRQTPPAEPDISHPEKRLKLAIRSRNSGSDSAAPRPPLLVNNCVPGNLTAHDRCCQSLCERRKPLDPASCDEIVGFTECIANRDRRPHCSHPIIRSYLMAVWHQQHHPMTASARTQQRAELELFAVVYNTIA